MTGVFARDFSEVMQGFSWRLVGHACMGFAGGFAETWGKLLREFLLETWENFGVCWRLVGDCGSFCWRLVGVFAKVFAGDVRNFCERF